MAEYNASSTTGDVLDGIDLGGRRILVTGVSSGLGIETARALAARGAEVIGTARDLAKAKAATNNVIDGNFELAPLDLASLASVRSCADRLLALGRPFDLIIANAGIMACAEGQTADGFETQFGTNHLGHFLLINRIAALLGDGGRLVNLSSSGHRFGDVDLDDLNFGGTPYDRWVAYGRSKTANILFTVEFDRRHRSRGIRAVAVHPGMIRTGLSRHLTADDFKALTSPANGLPLITAGVGQMKSVPQGAATSVWAGVVALANEVGGGYCEDCHRAAVIDQPSEHRGVMAYAIDPERAKELWAKSEKMVGESF